MAVGGAGVQGIARWFGDPLRPALWIGLMASADRAEPAEVAFVKEFELSAPMPRPALEAEGDREWVVEVDGTPVGRGSGPGARRFDLPAALAPGPHRLVAVVRHPTGVASIRLRLRDASGKGSGVVTARGWMAPAS